MFLDKVGVRGKLNMLLLLPLAAVVLVAVPFVAVQVGAAQSAATTARTASDARALGALVWELQRERVLTAEFLAVTKTDSVRLQLQQRAVVDAAENARLSLGEGASDELAQVLVRLGSLDELRHNVLVRGASLDSVARAYHAVIEAVIDALRLATQRTSDAVGTRQLTALDALLRANERSALSGMALVAAAVTPATGLSLLNDATAESQMFIERFVQQADADQAALVVLVDQGEAARRVNELVTHVTDARPKAALDAFVLDAIRAVEAQSSLRRIVQDQVTTQIANAAAGRASGAQTAAWTVGLGTTLLFALVMSLTVAVSRSIAFPLQRLTRAAGAVADLANAELLRVSDVEGVTEQPARLAAIQVSSSDEIGELATAFNRVQATAAMLVERQIITRRNVSSMFANVAQRTQNLVNRQLVLVDELERDEQDPSLLARLYRLDHLSTRLRRNAENLLVVAGTRDEARISGPTPLATALRSALAEIEEYQRVRIGAVSEVTVAASLASDIVLIFAELFENATAFSPPESTVEVEIALAPDGTRLQIGVIDHGIGMTMHRLVEENRRLVERERLDITPTSVLGLFVVGRLARRHGLRIELTSTEGGGISAKVVIPQRLFTLGTAGPVDGEPARPGRMAAPLSRRPQLPPQFVVPAAAPSTGFTWFTQGTTESGGNGDPAARREPARPAAAAATAPTAAAAPAPTSPHGLSRRRPGAQLPAQAGSRQPAPAARPEHDAAAARAAMDDYQSGFARGAAAPTQALPTLAPPTQAPRTQAPPAQAPRSQAPPAGTWPPARGAGPAPPSRPGWTQVSAPHATTGSPSSSPARNFDLEANLSRRVPGSHLSPGLRERQAAPPPLRPANWPTRDPEAERAAFDGFATGLAMADEETDLGITRPAREHELRRESHR